MQIKTRVKPCWREITHRCALRVSQPQTEQLQTLNSLINIVLAITRLSRELLFFSNLLRPRAQMYDVV